MNDLIQLLPTAGPYAGFLLLIIVLMVLWLRAEKRAGRSEARAEKLTEALDTTRRKFIGEADGEREKRWRAEDAAAKARRRKGGDLDGTAEVRDS
ncbi:MAG: hypothetical protein JWQ81_8527 [Amycolatopsis sp.]|uniref:hypothetical protein n=1 Tax=Amycolatopsis sp. TaxID=37632 RepID=UPI00261BAFC3|nr:hypothetical protein [Amycolatopsis sp.]MCU1687788.1 hypothetical protein [Amycolatopsis sp.]